MRRFHTWAVISLLLALAGAARRASALEPIHPAPPVFRLAVLPVEFPDRAHTYAREQLDAKFFSVGAWRASPAGAPQLGSVREYWAEVSYGRFALTGHVFPWARLSRPIDDYDGHEEDLVAEAKAAAGYDPRLFDGFALVYAGPQRVRSLPFRVHASRSGKYYVAPEADSADRIHATDLAGISTDCHELGHVLGLPDLYWAPSSLGAWDLMALNRACPQHLGAWSKEQLGWLTPRVVLGGAHRGRALPPLAASATADKIVAERSVFYVENRQRVGFDACLPAAGVVITHLDPRTNRIALVEADAGARDAHASEGDVFGPAGRTRFGCSTVPSSEDVAPGACAVEMTRISAPAGGDATYDLDLTWHGAGITVDGAGDYPSLFAAFEAVRPGQTVGVPPGVYAEAIAMKPGVALVGAGADRTVLRPPPDHRGFIVRGAEGVVVSGFTFEGGGSAASGLVVGDGAEVSNDVFRGFSRAGSVALVLDGRSIPALVTGNLFDADHIGVYRNGPADLRHNTFRRNELWTYANGAWPYAGGCNEVHGGAATAPAIDRGADATCRR